jgi:small neutral amino acid transporter SnatA (MarC family)
MCIALVVLLLFLFLGPTVMSLLDIAEHSLSIAGGIVLFIISVRLIFYGTDEIFAKGIEGEPFLFPLAVPFIAGPSAMASIFLLMAREPQRWRMWLLALLCAWFASGVILVSAGSLSRVLGPRTLIAIERLMGMLLVLLSVNMFLDGVEQLTGCG